MNADEAREALEPAIQQMVTALLDEDDDLGNEQVQRSLLSGWVLVTSSIWPTEEGTGTTVRVSPREGQADHVTTGLLRYAEKLLWEC